VLKSLVEAPYSRRAQRADMKRRTILRAAKSVFLKSGFGGTTMDAVAARAGVSKMTVYRHFEDKETLFAGVVTEFCKQIVDTDMEKLFEKEPEQALRGFARKMASMLCAPETVELHRMVIAECRRFPKLGRLFYDSGPEESIRPLMEYFARNKGRPELRIRDPRRSAEEFLELLRGYSHLRMLLGLQKSVSASEISERIEAAVAHVLVRDDRPKR
jgi:TetR/AcrR family transcriptional regulator, mexJK operon transcriptional repressor